MFRVLLLLITCACAFALDFSKIAEEVNSMETSWTATTPSFKSVDEVTVLLGKLKEEPELLEFRAPYFEHEITEDLPESFHPSEKWPMCDFEHVRDQSTCGSCWAFGMVEAFTDRICIATQGKMTPYISANNLLDCCSSCGDGCQGGWPSVAWNYARTTGIVTGGDFGTKKGCQTYPFAPCAHHVVSEKYEPCGPIQPTPRCQHHCEDSSQDYSSDKWYVSSANSFRGEKNMMAEIYHNGPMEIAIEVYGDFPTYHSGVYRHVSGSYLGGHAVKLVGWGVEDDGTKYWLVANSWNETWGDNGFIKILRGVDEVGIESEGSAGVPKL